MFKLNRLLNAFLVISVFSHTTLLFAKDVTVAFHIGFMGILGGQVAVYDYADYNERVLGNKSIIINNLEQFNRQYNSFHLDYDPSATKKFKDRFGKRFFDCVDIAHRDRILRQQKVDIFYILGDARTDNCLNVPCKLARHVMYAQNMEWQGDACAAISQWVTDQSPELKIPVVPHIVRLHETKENLRKELGIPEDAVVFGRHGSLMGFDLDYVRDAVVELAHEHKDWYFVFLCTHKFCDLPNVIYLPGTADMEKKTKFINTCDAMIHARNWGETFGLAVAEFSLQNKPVITCKHRDTPYYGLGHLELLGDKGFYYTSQDECKAHMRWIAENITEVRKGDWDCCSKRYSPEAVMKRFDEIFIQPLIKSRHRRSR